MNKNQFVNSFHNAIKNNYIYICYQPQYNHTTKRMIGAEALIRWKDPEYGEQFPSDFIPILEESNLIQEADLFVFKQVCLFIKKCIDNNVHIVPISFNISRYDILDENYIDKLEEIRKKIDTPSKYLRAEITESSAIGGMQPVLHALNKLHKYNYIVEMDDFGSGYSSLNILKDLPVDIIKLDMRFLSGEMNQRSGMILNSIIRMAKWLNTQTIAEGVETITQADYMKSMGCNYIQGYLYSKPIKEDEFIKLLENSFFEEASNEISIVNQNIIQLMNPDSVESYFFNNFVGPAAICSYRNIIDVIRTNDKFIEELGLNLSADEIDSFSFWNTFDEKNHNIYTSNIAKAIENDKEIIFDTHAIIYSECCGDNNVFIRNYLRVIGIFDDYVLLYLMVRNITEEKNKFIFTENNEAKLRFASEHAKLFAWEYDPTTNDMRPCGRCMKVLGLPPVIHNYPDAVIGSIFPEDYADYYKDWHKQIKNGKEHLEGIIPLTKDRIPYHIEYTTIFDENHHPLKAFGSATPVSEVTQIPNNILSEIAHGLAENYICVLELNIETEHFYIFHTSDIYKSMFGDIVEGTQFFNYIYQNPCTIIYNEDKESFKKSFTKQNISNELQHGKYSIVFRVHINNEIKFARLKAKYLDKPKNRILITIEDICKA